MTVDEQMLDALKVKLMLESLALKSGSYNTSNTS